ncbi:thioredoxin-like protein [Podospora appendiculata]|uniref:Thioredoxin-like protein n=1 Tax=Podospora appendiculata TaxID=314037 RepID=A0AAE0X7J6_9PEZI|nr:thioredoxin-like protein [Podospora appendiculata]
MRLLNLSLFFGAAALAVAASSKDSDDDSARENTYFNQKKVAPLPEVTPDTWEKDSKASKWLLLKLYSPWCVHCQDYAPTFQTLYEFYTTSSPGGTAAESDANFTSFYDFRFASVNCPVYYEFCSKMGVTSYPTTILYKDGEPVQTLRGVKNMTVLSKLVEETLEQTKPGTRPKTLELPLAGANSSPGALEAGLAKPSKSEQAASKEKNTAAKTDPSADALGTTNAKPAATASRTPKKAPKPVATPNLKGISVPLTAETFQSNVTMTQEPWFIKFYAPWCHHCQAMAPNWEQLAKEMKGKLNIGEVNCDAESRLCKDVRLRGYPSILFFKGGERVEYDGLRGLGDFVQYAEKAIDISSGVPDVDADSFKALEEKEEVIFVYFYDHATTSEDFMALERLPLSLIGHAKLVKTKDPALYSRFKITTWPRLLASREGRPTYYTPLTPGEMRNTRQVLNWMKSTWLPIVPEVTASNAREIMDGKIVVLGILNREDQESFASARREMKSAANEWMDKQVQLFQLERQELRDAKQLRIEEAEDRGDQRGLRVAKSIRINMDKSDRKQVTFAWVDGVFWQRWIRTTYGIDVKDGERVIINDEDNRRYWDQTITGNYIVPSRTSILETINKVTASPPKIKPKLTISSFEKIFFDIRVTFTEHPYLTMGCILGLGLGLASWFRGRLRRTRGHFRLDDSSNKAPLLGGINSNGKVD